MKTVEDYIRITGVEVDKVYGHEEASKILDKHVASIYRGRISVREGFTKTGLEIAETLYDVEKMIYDAIEKEFEDDED